MTKVLITCDSTADLDQLFTERNIPFTPLHVLLGEDKEGEDGIDIFPSDIFAYFDASKKTPKTAAVTQETYYEFFKKQRESYDEIVHFTISADMSACYNNAVLAAREVGGVYVVDSRNLSSGIGLSVLYAQDLAAEGNNGAKIAALVTERLPKVRASFVVDTMTFLQKGGRCSSIVALVASVLKIKPCILVEDGKMCVGKKYMGKTSKAIKQYVTEQLARYSIDDKYIFVTHTYADPDTAAFVVSLLREKFPKATVIETHAGATVTSHCGKGTLGILFFEK